MNIEKENIHPALTSVYRKVIQSVDFILISIIYFIGNIS